MICFYSLQTKGPKEGISETEGKSNGASSLYFSGIHFTLHCQVAAKISSVFPSQVENVMWPLNL